MSIQRTVVVGGAGAVGRLFAGVLEEAGVVVATVDRSVGFDLDAGWSAGLRKLLADADAVIVALPEAVALRHAEALWASMRSDALWVDTLSVKSAIGARLEATARPGERVSVNPMFAPGLGWAGQSVAWVEVAGGPRSAQMRAWLEQRGARVVPVTVAEHDRMTAATQAATHAAVLAFGQTLRALGYDAARSWPLATPPHRVMLALLARIAAGNPEVYWEIQREHPLAERARGALAEAAQMLGDLPEFTERMEETRRMLAPVAQELDPLVERLLRAAMSSSS